MFESTNMFFCMLARQRLSGRPVVADWQATNRAGDCGSPPTSTVPLAYRLPAVCSRSTISSGSIASSAARARPAFCRSRPTIAPPT